MSFGASFGFDIGVVIFSLGTKIENRGALLLPCFFLDRAFISVLPHRESTWAGNQEIATPPGDGKI